MRTHGMTSDHSPVDRLAEEFLERHRRGERPAMAEYIEMFVISGVAVTFFLGGWHGPGPGWLDPIWVIPSWWYLVLLALAIGLPLWWRRRSAQRYADLPARVEAAESRAADPDSDEDEWDRDDDWEPGR